MAFARRPRRIVTEFDLNDLSVLCQREAAMGKISASKPQEIKERADADTNKSNALMFWLDEVRILCGQVHFCAVSDICDATPPLEILLKNIIEPDFTEETRPCSTASLFPELFLRCVWCNRPVPADTSHRCVCQAVRRRQSVCDALSTLLFLPADHVLVKDYKLRLSSTITGPVATDEEFPSYTSAHACCLLAAGGQHNVHTFASCNYLFLLLTHVVVANAKTEKAAIEKDVAELTRLYVWLQEEELVDVAEFQECAVNLFTSFASTYEGSESEKRQIAKFDVKALQSRVQQFDQLMADEFSEEQRRFTTAPFFKNVWFPGRWPWDPPATAQNGTFWIHACPNVFISTLLSNVICMADMVSDDSLCFLLDLYNNFLAFPQQILTSPGFPSMYSLLSDLAIHGDEGCKVRNQSDRRAALVYNVNRLPALSDVSGKFPLLWAKDDNSCTEVLSSLQQLSLAGINSADFMISYLSLWCTAFGDQPLTSASDTRLRHLQATLVNSGLTRVAVIANIFCASCRISLDSKDCPECGEFSETSSYDQYRPSPAVAELPFFFDAMSLCRCCGEIHCTTCSGVFRYERRVLSMLREIFKNAKATSRDLDDSIVTEYAKGCEWTNEDGDEEENLEERASPDSVLVSLVGLLATANKEWQEWIPNLRLAFVNTLATLSETMANEKLAKALTFCNYTGNAFESSVDTILQTVQLELPQRYSEIITQRKDVKVPKQFNKSNKTLTMAFPSVAKSHLPCDNRPLTVNNHGKQTGLFFDKCTDKRWPHDLKLVPVPVGSETRTHLTFGQMRPSPLFTGYYPAFPDRGPANTTLTKSFCGACGASEAVLNGFYCLACGVRTRPATCKIVTVTNKSQKAAMNDDADDTATTTMFGPTAPLVHF